jgi:RND family efflux transporter MFP subunit
VKIKPISKKKLILILIIIIAVALGIYRVIDSLQPPAVAEKIPVNVTVAPVEINSIYATSPISGRIDPIETASIVPMIAGEVTSVFVSLGDYVTKDTVLFELDKTQSSTSYNQAKLAYDSAKNDYDRMSLLYNEGAVSLQQYQGAQTQFNLSKQNLTAASNALSYSTVKSPIDGFITSVNISVGGLASQAMPAVTVANVSELEINTSISEYLISRVKTGSTVDIYVKTLSQKPFSGTITAISPAPATGTLTYPITISVMDPEGVLKAGMFAEIQIVSDSKEDVLCIPSDAVFIKSGETKVAVINGDIPTLVTVTTGLDNGTLVEITSGLEVGDLIVVSGQQYVIEGESVNII